MSFSITLIIRRCHPFRPLTHPLLITFSITVVIRGCYPLFPLPFPPPFNHLLMSFSITVAIRGCFSPRGQSRGSSLRRFLGFLGQRSQLRMEVPLKTFIYGGLLYYIRAGNIAENFFIYNSHLNYIRGWKYHSKL